MGEFTGPTDEPYVPVVNKSLHDSTVFSLRSKAEGKMSVISAYTGRAMDFGGEQVWLAGGQGMLLRVGE